MLAECYYQLFMLVSVTQFPSCGQGSREGRGEVVDTNKEDRGIPDRAALPPVRNLGATTISRLSVVAFNS